MEGSKTKTNKLSFGAKQICTSEFTWYLNSTPGNWMQNMIIFSPSSFTEYKRIFIYCKKSFFSSRELDYLKSVNMHIPLYRVLPLDISFFKYWIYHFETKVCSSKTALFQKSVMLDFLFKEGTVERISLEFKPGYEGFLSGTEKDSPRPRIWSHLSHCVLVPSTKCYFKITFLSSPRSHSQNPHLSAASKPALWPFHLIQGHFIFNSHIGSI